MSFAIRGTVNAAIAAGVGATERRRSAACAVTASFVRRERIVATRVSNGRSTARSATSPTAGTFHLRISRRRMRKTDRRVGVSMKMDLLPDWTLKQVLAVDQPA